MGKHLFCALLCEIRGWKPLSLLKARISISGVYFSAVGTKLDFFNRIGQKQVFKMPPRIGPTY